LHGAILALFVQVDLETFSHFVGASYSGSEDDLGSIGCLQSLDWTSGLDWWTGLVDWTGGLTLKIIFTLFNNT